MKLASGTNRGGGSNEGGKMLPVQMKAAPSSGLLRRSATCARASGPWCVIRDALGQEMYALSLGPYARGFAIVHEPPTPKTQSTLYMVTCWPLCGQETTSNRL